MTVPSAVVVGGGSIGLRHARNLVAGGCPDVSVCDVDPSRREVVEQQFGDTVRFFDDLDAALGSAPALALVCVPSALHVDVALRAARAGCDLFIEKPLAADSAQVPPLARLVEERDLLCMVGCNMRFHPAIARIHGLLDAGDIGRVLSIRAHFGHYLPNWRPGTDYRETYSSQAAQGGGIILDAIHEIDYVRWLGGEVDQVACMAGTVSDLDIAVEDSAEILLRFESGSHASIHIDYLDQVKRRSCEVVGSTGTVVWRSVRKDPEEITLEIHRDNHDRVVEELTVEPNEPYLLELRHLTERLADRGRPLLDLTGAWQDLRIAEAARQAAASGTTVTVARST